MMSATEYGIGIVKNRFALSGIEEEVDPLELLKRRELEREARKKSKVAIKVTKTKEAAKPKSLKAVQDCHSKPPNEVAAHKIELKTTKKNNEVTKKHVTIVENNNKHCQENTTHFHEFEVDIGEAERRDYNAGSVVEDESVERGRSNRRGLPRGVFVRGGGRGNWRGYPRSNFDNRGKREYDRQSGSDKTGIKSIDKREGSGAHNWGNPRDDIDNIMTPYSPEETWVSEKIEDEPQVEVNETPNNEEENETVVSNVEEEEEKKELTLDEWKALKTPRKKPTYNIRKAGEGEDLSQWKKMYALEKKKGNEGEEYEYEFGDFPQRVGRQKLLEIDIRFRDTRNAGGGRGRGFGRGGSFQPGRGTDSPRQNLDANNHNLLPAPKVDDERDFPSLA